MSEHYYAQRSWSAPIAIEEVPETGRRVELAPDAATRAAVARTAGVVTLPRLMADFELTRHGRDGLKVVGRVSATVGQTCVVTLEPVENEVEEDIDLVFTPPRELPPGSVKAGGFQPIEAAEPTELLHNGTVDLGAVATEFLILGIYPYPRKAGAVFETRPAEDAGAHPFAALAALKNDLVKKSG
jgi:uncharacterized metal-binding protein YceD (DUF177 family)